LKKLANTDFFLFVFENIMCITKLPTEHDWKVVGHCNSNKAVPTDFKTSIERALHSEGETNGTRDLKESEPLMHEGSKAMPKVTAFGPALALRARKLYQINCSQQVKNKTCFDQPKRSNQHFSRHMLISKQSTQWVNNTSSLTQGACSIRNMCDTRTQEKRIQHPLRRQPFVRIASITPHPKGQFLRKPKNNSAIGYNGYTSEFVKEEPLNCKREIRNQGITILDLLGEMSSLSI